MMERNRERHIFGVAAIFIATTLIALTMLLFALLLYLAELIGSLIGALLIIGSIAAIIAFTLYFCAVGPQLSAIRNEVSAIYEMVNLARYGYDWVKNRVENFFKDL
ncbi:MAG: hypothetical protein R3Y39_00725 [Rikenellaceae bacterium]